MPDSHAVVLMGFRAYLYRILHSTIGIHTSAHDTVVYTRSCERTRHCSDTTVRFHLSSYPPHAPCIPRVEYVSSLR